MHTYDQQSIALIESYVKYLFKHTNQHRIFFDTKILIVGINNFHKKEVIGVPEAYLTLQNHYRQPCTLQQYQSPLFHCEGKISWRQREGYPFVFNFWEVFRLRDLETYGMANLTTLLTKLSIPF